MTFARWTSRAIRRAALGCALAVPGSGLAQAALPADSPFTGGETASATAWEPETGGRAMPLPPLSYPAQFPATAGSGNAARWTAHVAFELSGQIDLYASYATGYKARSANLARGSRPFGAQQTFADAAALAGTHQSYSARFARPEDTKVYEIGVRADWGPVNANLALFQQSITGSQTSLLAGSGFVLAQAGRETVRGAEIEATVRPARGWLVSAAVTYLDARYESYAVSAAGNLADARPPGIPALSSTIGAAREWRLAGGGRLSLRGTVHLESPTRIQQSLPNVGGASAPGLSAPVFGSLAVQDFAAPGLDSLLVASARGASAGGGGAVPFQAGVRELGASLTWAPRRGLDVTLWGRNIANDRYRVTVLNADGQPYAAWGYANQPQAFGTTLRLRY